MNTSFPIIPNKSHFDDMLIVRTRPGSVNVGPATVSSNSSLSASSALASTGYSALARYENAGLIKSVSPLSSERARRRVPVEPISGMGPLTSSIAAASAPVSAPEKATADSLLAGVSIVQIEKGADLALLQNELSNDANFELVSRVPIRYLQMPATAKKGAGSRTTISGIPPASSDLWNLERVNWKKAREIPSFQDADNVRVAVLDSGIQEDHPDLYGRLANYEWNYSDMIVQSGPDDILGHGTHVAGTIMANFENGFGIKGICNCELYAYKIFDDVPDLVLFPFPRYVYFVNPLLYRRALAECVINNIDVVNLSIGGPGQPDPIESQLFGALMQNGTSVVAAMGNEFQAGNPVSYPAAIPGVLAVGATNINDAKASFSNTGNHIALSAPGTGIWSTLPTYPGHIELQAVPIGNGQFTPGAPIPRETSYAAWDGTSMATPHVAAAAALLISNAGKFEGQDIKAKLQATARKLSAMGGQDFTSFHGSGCLDLEEMMRSVLTS